MMLIIQICSMDGFANKRTIFPALASLAKAMKSSPYSIRNMHFDSATKDCFAPKCSSLLFSKFSLKPFETVKKMIFEFASLSMFVETDLLED